VDSGSRTREVPYLLPEAHALTSRVGVSSVLFDGKLIYPVVRIFHVNSDGSHTVELFRVEACLRVQGKKLWKIATGAFN
jgi:hypothetical protein